MKPRRADVAISDIQPAAVQTWVATMAGNGVNAVTIENAVGQLRMILDSAVADRRIVSNPCLGIPPTQAQSARLPH